jgi:transcriptional regulator with XRE-family HTH domain
MIDHDRTPLPDALAALLAARGWTAYRLAAESGLTRTQVARIVSGDRDCTTATLFRLAGALGVSLAAFDPCVPPKKEPAR